MSLEAAPVVARAIRSGVVESLHHGLGVVTAADGSVLEAIGDPGTPVFARSSNKPLQAVAMLRAGMRVTASHLALVCASHSGQPVHVQGVKALLGSAGLAVEQLGNTPDYPWDADAREAWIREGRGKESVAQNCSGKHAGMLAACRAADLDLESYRDPEHPLQMKIGQVISELQGEAVVGVGVDGCGAPVHQLALQGLARAFGRIAAADAGPEREVADAMRAYPELVGGTGREATDLMRDAHGLIAKDGAEGVFAAGLADGRGVAVKIVDGNARASRVLLAELLRRIDGAPSDALEALGRSVVLGHGEPVGRVEWAWPSD